VGASSSQATAAGSGREKVSEVDTHALQNSGTDTKFQQSLLDVGLKSDPKSAKVSAATDVDKSRKQQKSTSTAANDKS